jgi:hypothetical protein
MTNVLDRIISLENTLGLDTGEKSENLATIKGYAAGIEMVINDFDALILELSPQTATGLSFDMMCNLFCVDADKSDEDKRITVINGYNQDNFQYKYGELKEIISEFGAECTGSGLKLTIKADDFKECGLLDNLGKILRNYLPPGVEVEPDGDGIIWQAWDNYLYFWDDFDRLDLSFNILDKLKQEKFVYYE